MAVMSFQEYQTKLGRDPNAAVTSGYKQYLFNQTGGSKGTDYGVRADPGGSGKLVSKSTGNVITDSSWAQGNKTAAAGNPNASKTPYRDSVAPVNLGGAVAAGRDYGPSNGFQSTVRFGAPGQAYRGMYLDVGGVQYALGDAVARDAGVGQLTTLRSVDGSKSISVRIKPQSEADGRLVILGSGLGGAKIISGGGGGGGVASPRGTTGGQLSGEFYSQTNSSVKANPIGGTYTVTGKTGKTYTQQKFAVPDPWNNGKMVTMTGTWDGSGWSLSVPAGWGGDDASELPKRLIGAGPSAVAPTGGGGGPAPAPAGGHGGGGGGIVRPPSSSGDRSVKQTGDLAYTREVVKPETQDNYETVQGQLQGLLSDGNPYVERARHMGRESAAARGLLNSSISAQAAEAAAIDAALPIASQDASTFFNQSMNNQNAINRFRAMGLSHEQAMQMAELSHGFAMEQIELQSKLGLSSNLAMLSAEHANRLQLSYLDAQMQIQMDPYLTPEQQVIAGNRAGQLWGQSSYYAGTYL